LFPVLHEAHVSTIQHLKLSVDLPYEEQISTSYRQFFYDLSKFLNMSRTLKKLTLSIISQYIFCGNLGVLERLISIVANSPIKELDVEFTLRDCMPDDLRRSFIRALTPLANSMIKFNGFPISKVLQEFTSWNTRADEMDVTRSFGLDFNKFLYRMF
jgi:hypothetical protein